MSLPATEPEFTFLKGGGEMAHLTRSYNWADSPLGPPGTWPQSLRTTLSILLNSKFPMFLFWGSDLVCFYNDAFRPSLGNNGKHSAVLGKPGSEVWPEAWPVISPLIEQVLAGGEASWSEDQLVPIYRNGAVEDVYWTFSYSPVCDESGKPAGVFVTCTETTQMVNTIRQLQASEQLFQNLVQNASVGIVVLRGKDMVVDVVNDAYARLIDRRCDELLHKPLFSIIPETEAVFRPRLDTVRLTGEPLYLYDQPYFVYVAGEKKEGFLNLIYQPYKEQDGTITGVMVHCQDVTGQKKAEEEITRFRYMAENACDPFILMREDGTFAYLNQLALDRWGYTADEARHIRVPDVDPIYTDAVFTNAFAQAQTGTIPPFETLHRKKDGSIYPVEVNMGGLKLGDEPHLFAVARDITERKKAEQDLRSSELRFRSLIEEAPVATCLFVGRALVIELANQSMIDVWGKGWSVLGQPLAQALPELEGQPFLQLIDEVFTTGRMHETKAGRADLVVDGVLGTYYFDYTFKALRTTDGNIYAVMEMAVDVTKQVLARQELEEAEAALRGAIELAELGTWQIDRRKGTIDYSERLRGWFGIGNDEVITPERAYRPVRIDDHPRVRAAIAHALTPGTDGVYDIEYAVDPAETSQERVLHIQGRAFTDETGEPYKLIGTARDVTQQRNVQWELERQVDERTQQLRALVQDLERSNQNLQQFAYVASHDLQEPLRKIQSFSDLLKTQYASQLADGADHLERIQAAAARMSVLIRDLLTFSRISTRQETAKPVSLAQVVQTVLTDLELRIQETSATITVAPLPTVPGDPLQLGQLFQNLLSNALKFQLPLQPGGSVTPTVRVTSARVPANDLPAAVRPTRQVEFYYRIDMADNGIGFDEKYLDRIFQVFQRLHGRSQFVGTGIGLAICEKVVVNHGGAITATSQPGQGATFSVYLPG